MTGGLISVSVKKEKEVDWEHRGTPRPPPQPKRNNFGPPKSRAAQLASIVGYTRRCLFITAVRAQAGLLLNRLQLLGDGAAAAAARIDWAVRAEAAAVKERRAQYANLCQGISVMCCGFGLL